MQPQNPEPVQGKAFEISPLDRRPAAQSKHYVIGLRCGQLGNRLIIFAHFIALAEELGCRVTNVTFHSYAHLFETTRRDIYCRYPIPPRQSWFDRIPGLARAIRKSRIFYHVVRYSTAFTLRFQIGGRRMIAIQEKPQITLIEGPEFQAQIRDARIVLVYGWRFRAPGCVVRHAEKIRTYFRPIPEQAQTIQAAMAPLRRSADVVVGVHIRYGDYRRWKGGKFFFPVARYVGWMREVAEQFPGRKVSFLICSDEPRGADEFPGLSVGFGPGSPLGDMYSLAGCDCIFGPLSTFTQWASFYGNAPLKLIHSLDDRLVRADFRVSNLEG